MINNLCLWVCPCNGRVKGMNFQDDAEIIKLKAYENSE